MRRAGWRPERRNRKLGTSDWAWRDRAGGQASFDVPWPTWDPHLPEASWEAEAIEEHRVHGQALTVVTERVRPGSVHACAPAEVRDVLACLPAADVAGIGLVVLRQPTRKQDILMPAWGRMHWCAEFRGYTGPAIALDAVDLDRPRLRLSRSLSPDRDRELDRMRQLGFAVTETRRGYDIQLTAEHLRRWLLARTIPHEVGHWADFRQRVLDPLGAISTPDVYETREYEDLLAGWWKRPQREREHSADRYADRMQPQIERCIGL